MSLLFLKLFGVDGLNELNLSLCIGQLPLGRCLPAAVIFGNRLLERSLQLTAFRSNLFIATAPDRIKPFGRLTTFGNEPASDFFFRVNDLLQWLVLHGPHLVGRRMDGMTM